MNYAVMVHLHQIILMLKETKNKWLSKETLNFTAILNLLSTQLCEDALGNVIFPTERTFLKM